MKFIGDVHGKYKEYKRLIRANSDTIQVGDLGLGFRKWPHGEFTQNPPYDEMVKANAKFIRGNHDNPAVCRGNTQWIKDGTLENGIMYIGGGFSIDYAYRYPEFTWWEDEELSQHELEVCIQTYQNQLPKVMITHDCPISLYSKLHEVVYKRPSRTPEAFEAMLAYSRPKIWVFGHHHVSFDQVIDDCRFVCLAELEIKEIEIDPFINSRYI